MRPRNREEWIEVILTVSLIFFLGPIFLAVLIGIGYGLHELWGFSPILACFTAPAILGFLGIMIVGAMSPRPSMRPLGQRPLGRPRDE